MWAAGKRGRNKRIVTCDEGLCSLESLFFFMSPAPQIIKSRSSDGAASSQNTGNLRPPASRKLLIWQTSHLACVVMGAVNGQLWWSLDTFSLGVGGVAVNTAGDGPQSGFLNLHHPAAVAPSHFIPLFCALTAVPVRVNCSSSVFLAARCPWGPRQCKYNGTTTSGQQDCSVDRRSGVARGKPEENVAPEWMGRSVTVASVLPDYFQGREPLSCRCCHVCVVNLRLQLAAG